MLAIGNNELKGDIGETIICPQCGKVHDIEYGNEVMEDGAEIPSTMLSFYKCGNKSYLAGIKGKRI